jgi:hypothetical protein
VSRFPGPWSIETGTVHRLFSVVDAHGVEINHNDEATARLIAAAPDLLSVCKRALAEKWCTPKTCGQGDPMRGDGCICNAITDAVAKAEGK